MQGQQISLGGSNGPERVPRKGSNLTLSTSVRRAALRGWGWGRLEGVSPGGTFGAHLTWPAHRHMAQLGARCGGVQGRDRQVGSPWRSGPTKLIAQLHQLSPQKPSRSHLWTVLEKEAFSHHL